MVLLELLGKHLCFSPFFGVQVGLLSTESCTDLAAMREGWVFVLALGNQEHLSSGGRWGFAVRGFSS